MAARRSAVEAEKTEPVGARAVRSGDITTIPLRKSTRDRLRRAGRKGETYDEVLNRLLELDEQIASGARVMVPFEEVQE